MRTLAIAGALALSVGASAQIFVVVPNANENLAGTSGLNTLIRDINAPRTYQMAIHENQLAGIPTGAPITGFTWRLWSGSTVDFPHVDATWANYDVYLSGSVDPAAMSTVFADNVVGTQTQVRSGSLTIPAGSFSTTGTPRPWGFEVTVTPWVYNGGHLLVEVRHTGSDITNPAGSFLDAVASTNDHRAMAASSYTATSGAGATFTITRISAVPEPGTMVALGIGLAALAARRRRK